jgi:hypothetical protein
MTDQDRKDHELAAKAAGYVPTWKEGSCKGGAYCGAFIERGGEVVAWRPKEDDGDAFRLLVDLKLFDRVVHAIEFGLYDRDLNMEFNGDKAEATRLAVFRCAVEIGRAQA